MQMQPTGIGAWPRLTPEAITDLEETSPGETMMEFLRPWRPDHNPIPVYATGDGKQSEKNWRTRNDYRDEEFNQSGICAWGMSLEGKLDLDCETPLMAAILPRVLRRPLKHWMGRGFLRGSHGFAACDCPEAKTIRLEGSSGPIIEVRAGRGSQTVMVGSYHPGSGSYRMPETWGPPSELVKYTFKEAVEDAVLAACVHELIPHYGAYRQDFVLQLSGFLSNQGASKQFTERLVRELIYFRQDDEPDKRQEAVEATYRKRQEGVTELAGAGYLAEKIGEETVKNLKKFLKRVFQPIQQFEKAALPDVGTRIIDEECELWTDHNSETYATFKGKGVTRHLRIKAAEFRNFLNYKVIQETTKPLTKYQQDACISYAEGMAYGTGGKYEPARRMHCQDGCMWIDLGDDTYRVVKIAPTGWEIVENADCPVRFVRTAEMLPLPSPARGGNIDLLWKYVNVDDAQHRHLVLLFLLAALNPHHLCPDMPTYPILALQGSAGAKKTSNAIFLGKLIDPQSSMSINELGSGKDLKATLKPRRVVIVENISSLSRKQSDVVCTMATGGGWTHKANYTDDEPNSLSGAWSVIITSINNVIAASDLASRTLPVVLSESKTRTFGKLMATRDQDVPLILGCLYDAVSYGLANPSGLEERGVSLPRLADVAEWVSSCEPALGLPPLTLLNAMKDAQASAMVETAAQDPWGAVVIEFMKDKAKWEGSTAELVKKHFAQTAITESYWAAGGKGQMTVRAFGQAKRHLFTSLKSCGIRITTQERGKNKTSYTIIQCVKEDD